MVTETREHDDVRRDANRETKPAAAYVDIKPKVHTNYGNIVGLQVDTITGDVHSTEVIVLTGGSRGSMFADRLEREKCPFPGIRPFTFEWRSLLFGREGKSAEILRGTTNHPLVVLLGAPRTGKTSLLCASIMPRVADFGALVARIDRYDDPTSALRSAIAQVPGPLATVAGPAGTLSEITTPVTQIGRGTFVLILDQFERAFDLPEADQLRLVTELQQALADNLETRLRIILSVRVDDNSERRLAALQEAIPGLLNYVVRLDALSRDEAGDALEAPLLTIDGPVQFASPEIRERVLDDLVRMSGSSGTIDPTALQLVGECLFARARDRRARDNVAPVISSEVYGDGAAAIVDTCLKDTYETRFSDDRTLADAIVNALIVHQDEAWIARNEIEPEKVDESKLDVFLRRFIDSGFLIHRRTVRDEYAFLNPTIAATMGRIADDDALLARRARQVLASAWTEWDVMRVPASRAQLHLLGAADEDLTPAWPHSLLLLRSAVQHREDTRRWLAALGSQAERLQALVSSMPTAHAPSSELQLLDVDTSSPPEPTQEWLAWVATRDNERVDRETSALALAATESLNPLAIETRLRPALITMPGTLRQRIRRARVWGALTDAGISLIPIRHAFDPLDRLLIWADKAGRRVSRNSQEILMKAGGTALGALGMGIGLGILRALIALTTTYNWQLQLSISLMWATQLGLMMGLAIYTTEAMIDRLSDWRVVVAGAIGFLAGHLWIMSSNSLSPSDRPLTAGLGLALGAVLATAVAYRDRVPRVPWIAWVSLAGITFGLSQAVLNQQSGELAALPLVQNGVMFYASEWQQESPRLLDLLGDWLDLLGIIDAALVGCALMAGLLLGTSAATRWLARWQEIEAKAGI